MNSEQSAARESHWRLGAFLGLLGLDMLASVLVLTPLLPFTSRATNETRHYTLYGSLLDLCLLAVARLLAIGLGLLVSLCRAKPPPQYPFPLTHPNGERKSNEELEQEALEEAFGSWFRRYVSRPSFGGEMLALVTQVFCVIKCLLRMNVEIGVKQDVEPFHPLFWLAVLMTAIFSVVEATALDQQCLLATRYGKDRFVQSPPGLLRSIGSSLHVPLLGNNETQDMQEDTDMEQPEESRGISDIGADASYKATLEDLLTTIYPDLHLICIAFVFLLAAASAQICIPRYLGRILDALAAAFPNADDNDSRHESMWEVPNFIKYVKLLVLASVLAGVFSGLRGSVFTVVGGRVNVRLRIQLMDSLLSQDIGFFDTTKTGDITSRLSSDTTLVGDQVTLNVNVFLRSLVQAFGVLLCMFLISWQLSILAFISVPLITILSKWYGNYVRSLTKLMQKKLADGNSVSEAAFGSMPTVRSFDAAEAELKEFEQHMGKYLALNKRSAVAYCGYAAFTTAVPQLVFAVVVFYGGMLVRNNDISIGDLVKFLLYLQALSDAFSSIGYIFSSLTQAVGAADKVFELLHRTPRYRESSAQREAVRDRNMYRGMLGIEAVKTRMQRTKGIRLSKPRGEIQFENVDLYYPARPQRQVLNKLSLKVEPGSIIALVGQSGGGKSSVMSLIQHLYEQSGGRVLLDGQDVHEISPECLSRTISIVSQEPTLFARSIKRNIMYGLEGTDMEPTHEEIVEAARLANAESFIETMPQK
jgi:ATP-binding cassette subfamily B (MDR/TAP) protein 9